MAKIQVYLASQSPRRRELLGQIGVAHAVLAVDLDEAPLPGEVPEDYARRVALDKARAGRAVRPAGAEVPVLAADTLVTLEGRILGKPRDAEEAAAMLRLLSGRTHRVLSAVALIGTAERLALSESQVSFRAIPDWEARAYWATGGARRQGGGLCHPGSGRPLRARVAWQLFRRHGPAAPRDGALARRGGNSFAGRWPNREFVPTFHFTNRY